MDAGQRIVITGVGRGLGRAMTEAFIARGHVVLGVSQNAGRIDELRQQHGPPHRFDVVNVADEAAVARWAQAILAEGGAPDLLINNAAIVNANAPLWQVPVDEFDRVIDVNVKGVFYVCKHILPAMIARRRGLVVNFSSGWGRSTSPEVAPYCASKYAIEGLTRALAAELPDGMAAIPLNPGIIDTDMLRSCFGSNAQAYPDPASWAEKAVPQLLASLEASTRTQAGRTNAGLKDSVRL